MPLDSTASEIHGSEGTAGVKEVQWSAFTSDYVENGQNAIGSYPDFFNAFGDSSVDQRRKEDNLISRKPNNASGNTTNRLHILCKHGSAAKFNYDQIVSHMYKYKFLRATTSNITRSMLKDNRGSKVMTGRDVVQQNMNDPDFKPRVIEAVHTVYTCKGAVKSEESHPELL
ncbi:hypothetical protein L6452_38979 [Arctium lappa]|uniref:Uncharacterized protein n=1 Tax=Arctium lappa TaxID=4217 RepID=A0ACB8XRK9_ARCLA|nr:hypothetical protein L6452_38979 [Arctium lappa]